MTFTGVCCFESYVWQFASIDFRQIAHIWVVEVGKKVLSRLRPPTGWSAYNSDAADPNGLARRLISIPV